MCLKLFLNYRLLSAKNNMNLYFYKHEDVSI